MTRRVPRIGRRGVSGGDSLRRAITEITCENEDAVRTMDRALPALFESDGIPAAAKADVVLGGLHRRDFLRLGATTVATTAVFAACAGSAQTALTDATTTTFDKGDRQYDVVILRTASSIEALAVLAYQQVIDRGLLSGSVADVAKAFQEHHTKHGESFKALTRKLGGRPFEQPNPAVMTQLQPTLAALGNEADALRLALQLEQAAAATYTANVSEFVDETQVATLAQAMAAVAGVEARHAAILLGALGEPTASAAFQTGEGAVAAGTGV